MKIEKQMVKVTKTVEVEVEEPEFVLRLNLEEARVLKAITGHIGGIGRARVITDEIYYGLGEVGDDRPGELWKNYFDGNPAIHAKY